MTFEVDFVSSEQTQGSWPQFLPAGGDVEDARRRARRMPVVATAGVYVLWEVLLAIRSDQLVPYSFQLIMRLFRFSSAPDYGTDVESNGLPSMSSRSSGGYPGVLPRLYLSYILMMRSSRSSEVSAAEDTRTS